MKKKYIREQVTTFSPHDLTGNIEIAIQLLKNYNDDYELQGYKNIHIDFGSYFGKNNYTVTGERLETDKEFQRRVNKEEKLKNEKKLSNIAKETAERKQLERLVKKYGVPNNA